MERSTGQERGTTGKGEGVLLRACMRGLVVQQAWMDESICVAAVCWWHAHVYFTSAVLVFEVLSDTSSGCCCCCCCATITVAAAAAVRRDVRGAPQPRCSWQQLQQLMLITFASAAAARATDVLATAAATAVRCDVRGAPQPRCARQQLQPWVQQGSCQQ